MEDYKSLGILDKVSENVSDNTSIKYNQTKPSNGESEVLMQEESISANTETSVNVLAENHVLYIEEEPVIVKEEPEASLDHETIIKNWQHTLHTGNSVYSNSIQGGEAPVLEIENNDTENLNGGSVPIFPLALVQNAFSFNPSMPFENVWQQNESQTIGTTAKKKANVGIKTKVEPKKNNKRKKSKPVQYVTTDNKISKVDTNRSRRKESDESKGKTGNCVEEKQQENYSDEDLADPLDSLLDTPHIEDHENLPQKKSLESTPHPEKPENMSYNKGPKNMQLNIKPSLVSKKSNIPENLPVIKPAEDKRMMQLMQHQCTVCKLNFTSRRSLKKHKLQHEVTKSSQVCTRSTRKTSLRIKNKVRALKLKLGKPHQISKNTQNKVKRTEIKKPVLDKEKRKLLPKTCDVCGRSFNQRANLLKHKRVHTGEKPYVCEQCGKAFASSSSLNIHRRTHTGERPYVCEICGMAFSQRTTMTTHKLGKHNISPPKTHTCDICSKKLPSPSALEIHKRYHTGEKPFVCDVCGKSFAGANNLRAHIGYHCNSKPYTCAICDKGFRRLEKLKKHQEFHLRGETEKPKKKVVENRTPKWAIAIVKGPCLLCDICMQSFSAYKDVMNHKHTIHGCPPYSENAPLELAKRLLEEKEIEPTIDSTFTLHDCDGIATRTFNHSESPGAHKCNICSKSFISASHLVLHVRIHTGEKPFVCYICNRPFAQRSHCVAHQKTHTKTKDFTCSVCCKQFTRGNHLKKHKEKYKHFSEEKTTDSVRITQSANKVARKQPKPKPRKKVILDIDHINVFNKESHADPLPRTNVLPSEDDTNCIPYSRPSLVAASSTEVSLRNEDRITNPITSRPEDSGERAEFWPSRDPVGLQSEMYPVSRLETVDINTLENHAQQIDTRYSLLEERYSSYPHEPDPLPIPLLHKPTSDFHRERHPSVPYPPDRFDLPFGHPSPPVAHMPLHMAHSFDTPPYQRLPNQVPAHSNLPRGFKGPQRPGDDQLSKNLYAYGKH